MTDELCRCCFVSTFLFSTLKRPVPLSPRGVSNETTCFSDHLCTQLLTWNDQLCVSPCPRGATEQIRKEKKGRKKRSGWFDVPQEDERKKTTASPIWPRAKHTPVLRRTVLRPRSPLNLNRVLIRCYTQPETLNFFFLSFKVESNNISIKVFYQIKVSLTNIKNALFTNKLPTSALLRCNEC